jgi:hypothetical protein
MPGRGGVQKGCGGVSTLVDAIGMFTIRWFVDIKKTNNAANLLRPLVHGSMLASFWLLADGLQVRC